MSAGVGDLLFRSDSFHQRISTLQSVPLRRGTTGSARRRFGGGASSTPASAGPSPALKGMAMELRESWGGPTSSRSRQRKGRRPYRNQNSQSKREYLSARQLKINMRPLKRAPPGRVGRKYRPQGDRNSPPIHESEFPVSAAPAHGVPIPRLRPSHAGAQDHQPEAANNREELHG